MVVQQLLSESQATGIMATPGRTTSWHGIITPALAGIWLERQVRNRPIREHHVARLAEDMRNGRWHYTGDTIKFDKDNYLIDGQHRLWAVIESGCTVEMLCVGNLDSDAQLYIDRNRTRSPADTLAMDGVQHPAEVAGALKLVYLYDKNLLGYLGASRVWPDNAATKALLQQHPGVADSAQFVVGNQQLRKIYRARSRATFLHYKFEISSQVHNRSFWEKLASGANLEVQDPVYLLRERLISESHSVLQSKERHLLALSIKAWNFHKAHRSIKELNFRGGGKNPEAFPTIW